MRKIKGQGNVKSEKPIINHINPAKLPTLQIYPAWPTGPVKSLLPLFNRDEISVAFISSGLNLFVFCLTRDDHNALSTVITI
jgi:hypothetical protein